MANDAVAVIGHDGWAELVLNRPERRNAITGPLGEALTSALDRLSGDEGVRLVLLRGAGGAFCSGLDLGEFNADPAPDWLAGFPAIWRGAHRALLEFDKPIVGALERYAINGGAALAIACDFLITGEKAFLQVGEAALGMAAPYNLAWLTLRHSEAVAARTALVGDRIAGPELCRLGLAQRAVPDDRVLAEARELCADLSAYPPDGLARIKAGLRRHLTESADAWLDRFTDAGAPPPRPPPR
jgi:enoyl-CoA hydratase